MTIDYEQKLKERAIGVFEHPLFETFERNDNETWSDNIYRAMLSLGLKFSESEHHTEDQVLSVLEAIIKINDETDVNKKDIEAITADDVTPHDKLIHLLEFYIEDGAFYISLMIGDVKLVNGDSGIRVLLDKILDYDSSRILDLGQITNKVVGDVGARYLPVLYRLVEMVGIMKPYDKYVGWINVDDENEVKVAKIISGEYE